MSLNSCFLINCIKFDVRPNIPLSSKSPLTATLISNSSTKLNCFLHDPSRFNCDNNSFNTTVHILFISKINFGSDPYKVSFDSTGKIFKTILMK